MNPRNPHSSTAQTRGTGTQRPARHGWFSAMLLLAGLCVATASPQAARAAEQEPVQKASRATAPGTRYALLVGVRKYGQASTLRPLRFPEQDVEQLATVLRGTGYRSENVMLMTQTRGAEDLRYYPLAKNIRRELQVLLRDLRPADSLLIAFSGHGVQFRDEDNSYFCPVDASLEDRSTLIALNDIYDQLKQCPARVKLLLCDACRNDPVADFTRRATVDLNSVTRPQQLQPPGGAAAFFSCSAGEVSYEDDKLQHGVFFHTVIEALKGQADLDQDSKVTLPEMELFVKKRVSDLVRARFDGARQMPQLVTRSEGLFPIVDQLFRPENVSSSQPATPAASTTPAAGSTPAEPVVPVIPASEATGIQFARIPAGTIDIGSDRIDPLAQEDELPRHRVRITRPFDMALHPVTVGQYARFVQETQHSGAGGYRFQPQAGRFASSTEADWSSTGFTQTASHPVVNVSWEDATAFCRWLSSKENRTYRLPTEAEWEYACRAGTDTRYWTGDSEETLENLANLADASLREKLGTEWGVPWDDGFAFTSPVGQQRANAFGLHDLHGGVWEWCRDIYSGTYYASSPATDPTGPAKGTLRVVRGGSWATAAKFARSADRSSFQPTERNLMVGFRIVREVAR